MEFSNLYFLFIILPLCLAVYFLVPDIRRKNTALLVMSLLLYAMGQPLYVPLLVLLSYYNYRAALRIRTGHRETVLLPVAVNILVLAVFKYLDFFLSMVGVHTDSGLLLGGLKAIVGGLNSIGFTFREPTTVLPIGISFYTFSAISYLVDVYRKTVPAEKSFYDLLLYFCLFPKMLQGPIVRYADMRKKLLQRKTNYRLVFEGAQRFCVGLAKKVLLADYCGKVIAELSGSADQALVGAWLSAILFTFQIYYDFSGYTDMAIGLGRIFGFKFCENFDRPYTSLSITEFWRRWHMSLGSFFKDYVYIPLGGNRMGKLRQIFNLLVVWALTGLWHGASWNFVLWGLYFFVLLAVEKQILPLLEDLPKALRNFVTMLLVLFGWVLFSHEDFTALGSFLKAMLGFGGLATVGVWVRVLNSLPLMAACFLGCTKLPGMVTEALDNFCGMAGKGRKATRVTLRRVLYVAVCAVWMGLLLWLCTVSLVGNTSAPSIYGGF